MPFAADIQTLAPGARVELFQLDATAQGGSVLYFHNNTTVAGGVIVFAGNTYTIFPIQASGFERSGKGVSARPTLSVSNIGSAISAILRITGDLLGAKVTRLVTFGQYLTTPAGATPDGTQILITDTYSVNRKVAENKTQVDFELSTPFDVQGVQLPRRQIVANACPWVKRGGDCPYTGKPVMDALGNALTATTDRGAYAFANTYAVADYAYILVNAVRVYYVCIATIAVGSIVSLTDVTKWTQEGDLHTLAACKAHWITTVAAGVALPALPFGGFPGTARLPRA